ncbi:reprolysin-like metallopeptidase [Flavobacterium dankookense]|uniref:Putative secreted protein (Por secretion system target) n=1 Tax=Flavobacterium dankookense TaxID=706186 RepID=A0A4R6QD25_9FLAO|nr:zinc-dependent metalloprotease family protein [Flavobacterium dankookense]TDP60275.1 putative secreted protein (Por secretion system target) [Flavobacterium dankookense]
MKYKLLSVALLAFTSMTFAQGKGTLWNATTKKTTMVALEESLQLPENKIFELNLNTLRSNLNAAPKRMANGQSQNIISIPNADGNLERFRVFENTTMEAELAAKYPEIKSYIGIGIDNPLATAYFSVSPLGFKSMVLSPDKSAEFIEPISTDLTTYTVYRRADKSKSLNQFECSVVDNAISSPTMMLRNANDSTLRTFRLAVSCTGEYAAYFGGTKAQALAAINASMTRVNGIFEKDFAVRMVLIANNDLVLYTDAATDPYTTSYNSQLQSTLTSVIGDANYDVGHVFVRASNNGNAGCIGCVCASGKGSGFTSSTIPTGDTFDIDYVAHEIGHQFGANHTFSMSNEGTGVNMEPGSGSTIMGYAGITSQDVQTNSDAYFHAASIQQVTNNVKTKTCQTNTPTGNSIPTANAGLDYTIPKSTPFMLTGSGTDANGDVLTYNWEQFDNAASTATGASSAASATRTTGPTFRSYNSSTTPVRYFPNLSRVLAGATTTQGTEIVVEALPSVARTMNFRLTVRDNRAGGAGNNSDDMVVTVNGTAGPFSVSAPNTAVSYVGGTSQTVTWNVAGTTANGVNCANVDILISTDGGTTWSTLLAATPNDGSQAVTIPNTAGTTNRIMVKGTNHIFFDVSNTNFTITSGTTDTVAPTAPTLNASGTTLTSTNLSWSGATDNVAVTGYDVYRGTTLLGSTASTTFAVTGLTASTTYSFTVRAKDAAGNVSADSNTVSVTTLTPTLDTTAPTAPTLAASGTTTTTTNLSWSGATDNVAVTGYDVYRGTTLLGSTASTTYAVTGLTASTTYSFSVRAKDAAGNISADSNVVSVTTLAVPTVTYCASKGNSTADEYINRVQLGSINNLSGNNAGYGNFTALSTNLTRSTSNTITITPAWTGTVYSEGYRVWIDYNQDGDFADTGEQVFNRTRTTATPISGSFTVPATALIGQTRMRVSMKYNASPTSCETFSYGEVEDYTVNIVASGRFDEETPSVAKLTFKLYPNPVKGDALHLADLDQTASYRVFNVMGQELSKGKIEDNTIYVGSLKAGAYLIEVSSGGETLTKRFIKE